MIIRPATIEELTKWWDNRISQSPNDNSWVVWKNIFIEENLNGKRKTFFAFEGDRFIGQCTLLFESEEKVITGNYKAEINKLEIIKEERGKGLASKIYKVVKDYAKEQGMKTLTIGVEPCEIRNMQIYFHWGFTNYLQCITETYPPAHENVEGEVVTVLCYSQEI